MANLTKTEKRVLAFECLFVAGAFVYLFFAMAPNGSGFATGNVVDGPIVFEIENGDSISISTDADFSNPINILEGEEVILPPGYYYWKVNGLLRESKVYSFKVESKVGLNIKEGKETDILENSGNVPIEVSKKGITSGIPIEIEIGKSQEVDKDNSIYEGGQNG